MGVIPVRYKAIADYGLIGNCRAAALVGVDGSIDWCCLPDMSGPSVFAAILDADRGGRFTVSPVQSSRGEQRYAHGTNILVTTFDTPDGRLTVTDFFPVQGNLDGCGNAVAPPEIHRLVAFEGDACDVSIVWEPRFDYGRTAVTIETVPGGFEATDGASRLALNDPDGELAVTGSENGSRVEGVVRFTGPAQKVLVTSVGHLRPRQVDSSRQLLEETEEAWRNWAFKDEATGDRAWAGAWREEVLRSELVLKLLAHAETGAIAAAPTTSLPESIGGTRNWDYRFCWIRDAAMTARAFMATGHDAEMLDFVSWAERVSEASVEARRGLQIMYGLRGEREAVLEELHHLSGYWHSSPVRIGNHAIEQNQPDIFGELLDAAHEVIEDGHALPDDVLAFLPSVADGACEAWLHADHGLWEMPLPPRHYVHSKAFAWVALDRAVSLADSGVIQGDVGRWRHQRKRLQEIILRDGYNDDAGAFTQVLGGADLDAAALLLPIEGVVPFDDPRARNTIDAVRQQLTTNDLVYRYHVDDGLPGEEGAFVLCTTWLVSALARSGRVADAEVIFDRLIERASPLGLLAEQMDPYTGAFLGNFPQAFSHIGVINSALDIARAQGELAPRTT